MSVTAVESVTGGPTEPSVVDVVVVSLPEGPIELSVLVKAVESLLEPVPIELPVIEAELDPPTEPPVGRLMITTVVGDPLASVVAIVEVYPTEPPLVTILVSTGPVLPVSNDEVAEDPVKLSVFVVISVEPLVELGPTELPEGELVVDPPTGAPVGRLMIITVVGDPFASVVGTVDVYPTEPPLVTMLENIPPAVPVSKDIADDSVE